MRPIAPIDHENLLAHVLHKPREWVLAHPEIKLRSSQRTRFTKLLTRKQHGEPLAHLLGEQWFYGRPFTVNRSVLIPRPETELLVELALHYLRADPTPTHSPSPRDGEKKEWVGTPLIIDVGTGSSVIAVTLAKELSNISDERFQIFATDASPTALRVARGNARRHDVLSRITFLRGNLLAPLFIHSGPRIAKIDDRRKWRWSSSRGVIVVANLPYLTTAEWRALPRSIRDYEPHLALDGGPDGLKHFRQLFAQLRYAFQIPDSRFQILLEIDPRRKRALTALTRRHLPGWEASWHRDLAGRWRVLELTAPR